MLPSDKVKVNGKTILPQTKRYVLLNKPKGYITTMSDDRGRKIASSLVENIYLIDSFQIPTLLN